MIKIFDFLGLWNNGIKMFNSKDPDIFGKFIKFSVNSAQSVLPTVQNNKQIFCKAWHSLNFNFTLIMKLNL